MHWPALHHARVELNLAERAFVPRYIVLQDAQKRLRLLRTQIDALEVLNLHLGLALLKQIHSATCLAAEGRTGLIGDGDALVENTPGVSVAVRTADCLPILLVDERCRAVAAVHAGWRGTVAGIVRHAVAALQVRFGSKAA